MVKTSPKQDQKWKNAGLMTVAERGACINGGAVWSGRGYQVFRFIKMIGEGGGGDGQSGNSKVRIGFSKKRFYIFENPLLIVTFQFENRL